MAGMLLGIAALVAAGVVAAGGKALNADPRGGTVTPFGGPVAVHIAHPGRIDVDLESSGPYDLSAIACPAAAARDTQCYVGR